MPTNANLDREGPQLRIKALKRLINSHGYVAATEDSEPLLTIPSAFGPPVEVHCDSRSTRDGKFWFFFHPIGRPIAPADADHLSDVAEAVKEKLAAQEQAWDRASRR